MIPMARPEIGKEEIEAVINVIKSGNLREGQVCKQLEEKFAKIVGAEYATTFSSGTSALHAAYLNLIKPGDEVLVTSFTFFATASMICWAGGIPVFCDIDPETFCIDVDDAKSKITSKTKAIAPVHIFGNACDIDEVKSLADQYGLAIVWDAAQAHLTKYKGNDVGSYGDAVCYSFYATKNMTCGEGGMITSDNKKFIDKCILLKHQGQSGKYYHTMMGTNYRMTDMQAAIGLVQLGKIERFTQKRRENAAILNKGFESIDGIKTPYCSEDVEHCYHQYTILLEDTLSRESVINNLRDYNIGSGINYPIPLHLQPVFEEYARGIKLPISENTSEKCLSIPVHPGLSSEDLKDIIEAVRKSI